LLTIFLLKSGRLLAEWAQFTPSQFTDFTERVKVSQAKHFPTCAPLPGVPRLLQDLVSTNPRIKIALASSSHRFNYQLKTAHLSELFSVFPEENMVLGDDPRIMAGRGKPAPDIYLLALKTINDVIQREGKEDIIKPEECLVFEDAVPGVEAGRRAGMQVVWCPHPGLLQEYKGREKEVLAGLTGTYKEEAVQNPAPVVEAAGQNVTGSPGKIDDGYATLVKTLEDFPYSQFGIHLQKL